MLTVSGTQGGDTKIVTSRDTGVDIYDSDGNKVGNVPYGKDGITGKGETVYQGKDKDGNVTYSTDPYKLQPYISFNDTTGKITMHAPQEFFDSDVYKQYFNDDVISGLSKLYQQNKDAKVELTDGSQKTVKELIEAWNEDLPKIVAQQKDYYSMKNKVTELLGEEAGKKYNLSTYQIQGTSAYSGRDDDYLTIPKTILNNPNWSFFKNLEGFDHSKLVITKKDFDEGYYHLDAIRDLPSDSKTSISKLKKDVANAIANFKGDDVNEFARLIAFNNFLNDQTAEGASNAPEGSFTDTLVINGAAFSETAMRNTAEWANSFVNGLAKFALAPFSAVDWAANLIKTGESKWEWKYITDAGVDAVSAIVGDDLTPNANTVAEFLQNEEARRGDIYKLTDSAAGLIYDIGGTVVYAAESVISTIALNRVILNGIALGISGLSIKRSIPKIVENANALKVEMERAATLSNGIPAGTVTSTAKATPETVVAAYKAGIMGSNASAGTKAAVNLLTSGSSMSVWEKMKLISSLNTADIVNGALQWHSVTSNIGAWLASNAEAVGDFYRAMEQRELGALGQYATWRTVLDAKSKYAQTYETLAGIFASGNALLAASGKMMISLSKVAKYVPTAYYAANIVVGTAMAESDSLRRLMDGVDNDEERSLLWSMVAKTALGWTIAMVAGHIVNKVFSGQYDDVIEQANAKVTENIAKSVHGIRGRIDQVHELMAGKDWIDNVKSPTKKAAILYNQSLQKSQEYMAKAADEVRSIGGTEREARNATIMAINQMKANQNAIDLSQNTDLIIAAWHTNAYPAYAHASETYTGIEQELSKKLAQLGLSTNVQTTALIGGVASNGEYPQDVVNYIVRAQQRQSYLRDDYDYTAALTVFGQNIDTADVTSMYVLSSPSYIAERDIAKEVMRVFEDTHPKELADYIKDVYVPASFQAAYQLNQVIIGSGYYLESREEGWRQSGMFGNNNQLWFPMLRVTDAQRNFEEAAKNPVEITKRGAVKRRFYEPEHYAPGSSEMMDFVNPMITFRMYEYQKAIEYSINNWIDVNMQNPFVKHITRLDGAQVGAVKMYNDLKPHYESSVVRAMNATYQKLDVASLVNDIVDKGKFETKVKNAQKAVDAAKETWDNIPNIEVKPSSADKLRVIEGLDEITIDDLLTAAKPEYDRNSAIIRTEYKVKSGSEGLKQRERIADIDKRLKADDKLAEAYRNGLSWQKNLDNFNASKELADVEKEGLIIRAQDNQLLESEFWRSDTKRGKKGAPAFHTYAYGKEGEAEAKTYGEPKKYDLSDKMILDVRHTSGASVLQDIMRKSNSPDIKNLAEKIVDLPIGEDRAVIDTKALDGYPEDFYHELFDLLGEYGIDGIGMDNNGLVEAYVSTKPTVGDVSDTSSVGPNVGVRADENGVKVKKVPINGEPVEIDVEIADRISAMNKDGYITHNSCSGIGADHAEKSDAGKGYIDFDGGISPEKKEAITRAAEKAGLGVHESKNPVYPWTDFVVRHANTKDGIKLEDVVKMANERTAKKYKLDPENWVDEAVQKKNSSEIFKYRDEAIDQIYKEHGGYAQPNDKARKKSWDIFFNELGYGKNDSNSLSSEAETRMKEFADMHITAGKNAAKSLGYKGDGSDFEDWLKAKKDKMIAERTELRAQVDELRGSERAGVEFTESLYSDEEIPKKYISSRSKRQEISDDALGVWNGYNGGLAFDWLNDGNPSAKAALRTAIEGNKDLRAALLSTMYDNSGSDLPYEEWLNTPITLRRQQVIDSLRKEDAFLSFSMSETWEGIGGLTERLDTEPGDIITLSVRPRDTLGEIPKGVEAEDELEVMVPREVYATAMSYAGQSSEDLALKRLETKRKMLKKVLKEICK